ncbi:MAG TPA: amino acid ABC transporter ATP-binding protein [Candidatus Merdenecus merdavium]|nr:amino acid ABC transporter ATP-binding protein [Candidatus Merdenecus merdavium]
MIEINHLSKKFGTNLVLDQIDLTVKEGDVVGIIGPSGTGKSTLLRCINFLEQPDTGSIHISGTVVEAEKKNRKNLLEIRQKTAMVFQQFNLFKRKTALQNIMEGLIYVKKLPKEEAERLAKEYLKKVGLEDRMYHYPKQLSGGQQQRVAIARALAMKPELLLFDEPTSALDPELVKEVLDTIKIAASEGNTMLIVSHEMNFIKNVANRVIFLDGGKIVEDGSPSEVFQNPKSQRAKEFFSNLYYSEEPEYFL